MGLFFEAADVRSDRFDVGGVEIFDLRFHRLEELVILVFGLELPKLTDKFGFGVGADIRGFPQSMFIKMDTVTRLAFLRECLTICGHQGRAPESD